MFAKNKFQYCIYNHERLELHELQKEYQKDKAGTKLKYENQLFAILHGQSASCSRQLEDQLDVLFFQP